MLARTPAQTLTAADLKDNLQDIQDNVVTPILMRYGRHIFFKFNDGAKARTWLRNMFELVNARPGRTWDTFHRQYRLHLRRSERTRALQAVAGQLSRGVPGRHAGPRAIVGDVGPNAPEHWEGGLGGPDIQRWQWIRTDSDEGREEATRIIRDEMAATGGVEIRFVQDTMALAHENGIGSEGEHFGFADPISQPPIEGADAPAYPGDGVQQAGWHVASAQARRVPARL